MIALTEGLRCDLLALPEPERAELAHLLLDSLAPMIEADEIAFEEELERRAKEIEEGRVVGIPIEEVFARLDVRLAARKK